MLWSRSLESPVVLPAHIFLSVPGEEAVEANGKVFCASSN
jgi:hypothetical protein